MSNEQPDYTIGLSELTRLRDNIYNQHISTYTVGGLTLPEIRKEFEISINANMDHDGILRLSARLIELNEFAMSRLRDSMSAYNTYKAYLKQERARIIGDVVAGYTSVLRQLPSRETSEFIDSFMSDKIATSMMLKADVDVWQSIVDELTSIGWRIRDMVIAITSRSKLMPNEDDYNDRANGYSN